MHYAELRGRELCLVCTLNTAYEDVGSIPGRRILQGILIIELNMMDVSDQRCDAVWINRDVKYEILHVTDVQQWFVREQA